MKKITVIAAAVLVLFTGCNKEEIKPGSQLTASMDVATKTSLSGKQVSWVMGDQMTIIDGSGAHTFTAQSSGRNVPISSPDEIGGEGTYWGFYPASLFESGSGGSFTGSLLVNQFIEGTQQWDPNAPIMLGKGTPGSRKVSFVNAHALVELTFPATAQNITVNTPYAVSGSFSAALGAENSVTITPATEHTSKFVALVAKEGSSLAANTPYYLAAFPMQKNTGVTIIVRYTGSGVSAINQEITPGMYFYNIYIPPVLEDLAEIDFPLNKITQIDLGQAHGARLTLITAHNQMNGLGTFLFMGDDGNALVIKSEHGNAWKFTDFQASIYSSNYGDDRDKLMVGAGGTHCMEVEFHSGTGVIKVTGLRDGNGTSYNGYLAYATNHTGGFYIVNSASDATTFEVYELIY